MGRVAGYAGNVELAGATAMGIRNWELNYTREIHDGRGFDSAGLPAPVLGVWNWDGKFAGLKDGAPLTLFTLVGLALRESTAAGQVYSGSALLTGIHPTVAIDGLVEYAYDFIGSGALTIATA